MADRWLFAGGAEGATVIAGTLTTTTTTSYFNSANVDHAVVGNSSNIVTFNFVDSAGAPDAAVSGETLHVHVSLSRASGTANSSVGAGFELQDSSSFPWLALRNTGSSNTYALYYNSGTGASPTWTQIGSSTANIVSPTAVDIWITLGATHSASWAIDSSLQDQGTFTQGSLTELAKIRTRSGAVGMGYSEVMATVGISLVGAKLQARKATGAGSNSAWSGTTGTFADIDDAGINDTDALTSGTAGQRHTFAYSNISALGANEAVGEVFLWTRARNSGGAPSNVKPVRRDGGGTDNVGSSFSGITGAYQSFLTRYSGLSESEVNASEFGVESAT